MLNSSNTWLSEKAGFASWTSKCQMEATSLGVWRRGKGKPVAAVMKKALDKLQFEQSLWNLPQTERYELMARLHHYWDVKAACICEGPAAEPEKTLSGKRQPVLQGDSWTPPSRSTSFLKPQLPILPRANKGTQSLSPGYIFPCVIKGKELILKLFCFRKGILSISKLRHTLDFTFTFQFLKAISPPLWTMKWFIRVVRWVINWAWNAVLLVS